MDEFKASYQAFMAAIEFLLDLAFITLSWQVPATSLETFIITSLDIFTIDELDGYTVRERSLVWAKRPKAEFCFTADNPSPLATHMSSFLGF